MTPPCQAPLSGESPGLMSDWYARPDGSPQRKPAGSLTQSKVPRPAQKDGPRGATRRNPQPRSAQQPARPPAAALEEPQPHVAHVAPQRCHTIRRFPARQGKKQSKASAGGGAFGPPDPKAPPLAAQVARQPTRTPIAARFAAPRRTQQIPDPTSTAARRPHAKSASAATQAQGPRRAVTRQRGTARRQTAPAAQHCPKWPSHAARP